LVLDQNVAKRKKRRDAGVILPEGPKGRMFRAAVMILSGNALGSVLLLVRTLIVARLIPVEDFGIAATFALSMAVVEMLSALGLQQQIVQARDGNDPRLQAGLQGFQVLRGLVSGAILFLLAGPISRFLGVPEVMWAYQLLALVPVMNALVHFDIYRMNRAMVYLPGILTVTVPALVSVVILWPLAAIWNDWRVMLYAILAQGLAGLVTSHLVAERPYRLILDRAIMLQSLRFGWPLLANGILLFLVFNGEKLIVGRELGMATLAIFSMGFTLTLTPTLVMARSAQSFFLPQLSASPEGGPEGGPDGGPEQDGKSGFAALAMATLQAHLVFAMLMVTGAVLVGPQLVHLLLGPRYEDLVPVLTLLAILQGIRVFKGGPSTVALARAQTENAFVANILRVALLPVAWIVVAQGGTLLMLILLGILGEVLGAFVAFALLRWRLKLRLGPMLWPLGLSLALMAVAGLHGWQLEHPDTLPFAPGWTMAAVCGLCGLAVISMADLRRYVARRRITRHTD
jgi:O-antigen/teichoic acid export membrane protein